MSDTITRKAARPKLGPLDWAMAALLAGAVGFVSLVAPLDPLLSEPLSAARLMLTAPAVLVVFVMVALLLRALSKPVPAWARSGRKTIEIASAPPRLRRADAHPDAPSRSPILAARELGVPLDDVAIHASRPAADLAEVENVDFDAVWKRPLPGFINEPEAAAWEPVDETQPQTDTSPLDIPFWMPAGAAHAKAGEPDVIAPAAAVDEEPLAVPFRRSRRETEKLDPAPDPSSAGASGLGRRHRATDRGPQGDDAIDERLRSALGDLKRMAGNR